MKAFNYDIFNLPTGFCLFIYFDFHFVFMSVVFLDTQRKNEKIQLHVCRHKENLEKGEI